MENNVSYLYILIYKQSNKGKIKQLDIAIQYYKKFRAL